MADETTTLPTEDWTYLGRRLRDGKRYYVWAKLAKEGQPRLWQRQQIVKGWPVKVGSTWRITLDPETPGSFWVSGEHGPKAIDRPDYVTDDLVARWAAEDQAAEVEVRARKAAAEDLPDLATILHPVKLALARQHTRTGRAAIIAAVLAELGA